MLTDDLRDLYQEVILDHQRDPSNFRELPDATHKADGHNPLCGDRVSLFVKVEGDTIDEVTFRGSGCAISTASASLMTELLQGKTLAEADQLFDGFHRMVAGDGAAETEPLGKLRVLAGVREFPGRVKCATLAWHTLQAALKEKQNAVSTE